MDHAPHGIVISDKEKFQSPGILAKQQAHPQSSATLKNIFTHATDGNSAMNMRFAKAVWNDLKRFFNSSNIRITHIFEGGMKAWT